MYQVLLYYEFAKVADPDAFTEQTRSFCQEHNLKGRILISEEGINGTCCGAKADTDAYKAWMKKHKGFENTWYKEQTISHMPFPKLKVRSREELVTLRSGSLPVEKGGIHLSPKEVNEMAKRDDVVFLDTRNEIESRVGKFKGAIAPNMKTFRDFPKTLEELDDLKDKKIITYCTGGIRCEKATVLMKEHGFEHVYQISGGIYNYCTQFPDGLFEGTCFVFDDRMQIGFGKDKAVLDEAEVDKTKLISNCEFCKEKSARCVNDERFKTRELVVCCEACDEAKNISKLRTKEERAARDSFMGTLKQKWLEAFSEK
jgi:UPF0176 protein